MSQRKAAISFFVKALYFFPLQLLFVHLKKNLQLLLFWLFLFLAIFQQIGTKYGLPLLFLEPEYLGYLNFWSYFIVGFALGGFVMAFNISSYIMNGFRFPFLATLSRPFLKYCINNSVIPLGFIVSYLICTYQFLDRFESFSELEIIYKLSGFLFGYFIFIILSMAYFMSTNTDFEKLFGKDLAKVVGSDTDGEEPARLLLHRKSDSWYNRRMQEKTWRVESYIGSRFKLKSTRPYEHYDFQMLSKVFRQNHVNASFFEITVIISILVLGFFREVQVFIIPAGATIILLLTMILMASSALRSWLRGWTWLVIFALLVGINELSKYDTFYFENRAYGLSYDKNIPYHSDSIVAEPSQIAHDRKNMLEVLDNWRGKFGKDEKPKVVFIACSGGGSRAMYWSFLALQHLDQVSHGNLMKHSIMLTGSSGGMIGAAYFRELLYQDMKHNRFDRYTKERASDMSKDLLNPVFFTMAVNDMLIKTQRFEYDSVRYWKDRAYAFEKELNKLSHGYLDHPLDYYKQPVYEAKIPLMIFSPSVVNESRRMLISSHGLSFLCSADDGNGNDLDFQYLFRNNNPGRTRFLSLLRINSSFPYIMPSVSLPSKPSLELFDSGLRDNYGIQTTTNFINQFEDWLEENTSGIIILQIRDGLKNVPIDQFKTKRSIGTELLSPFGSLYGNLFQVQDIQNDQLLQLAKNSYKGKIEVWDYQLNKSARNNISLSWHLTSKEKNQIKESLNLKVNKEIELKIKNTLP